MNDDEAAFLRRIIEAPADDTPRLVYADWLEENAGRLPCPECAGAKRVRDYSFKPYHLPDGFGAEGVPYRVFDCPACQGLGRGASDGRAERAEFIRLQCQLANPYRDILPDKPDHARGPADVLVAYWEALRGREAELLDVAAVEDWAGIPAAWDVTDWWFVRGFVGAVRLSTLAAWAAVADRLRAAAPVEEVRLGEIPRVEYTVVDHADDPILPWVELRATVPDIRWVATATRSLAFLYSYRGGADQTRLHRERIMAEMQDELLPERVLARRWEGVRFVLSEAAAGRATWRSRFAEAVAGAAIAPGQLVHLGPDGRVYPQGPGRPANCMATGFPQNGRVSVDVPNRLD